MTKVSEPRLAPFHLLATEGQVHTVMSTVRVPLHSFIINRSGVTLNDVDTVRFRFTFPTQGEVHVDDVEFSR